MDRVEKRVEGCLLHSDNLISISSKGPILICGTCPNRSDKVGNLADDCHYTPEKI